MLKRPRFKQAITLQDRLASFAKDLREKAARLAPGVERDDLLNRASRADTAVHLNDWANSPGLQSPK